MKATNFSTTTATMIMETISGLQRTGDKATLKDIKAKMLEKFGTKSNQVMARVPQFIMKCVNLGLIRRYGDNYRTKINLVRRRRSKRTGGRVHKRRRRRRGRSHATATRGRR